MIQTNATGHAGNKRRSDSAVAQQLTPANTRKRAAKTKRLNLFCSIISKQNEVRKIIQINSPCKYTYFPTPPNLINTYSKSSQYKTTYLNFIQQSENQKSHATSQNEQFRRRFFRQPTPPGTTSSRIFRHLFTKYAPSPRHSLNNRCQPSPIPAPSRENNRRSKSIQPSYPYFPHTPNDDSPH